MTEKNKVQNNMNNRINLKKKSIIISALIVAIVVVTAFTIPNIYTDAQVTSTGQTLNSIKQMTPVAVVVKEKLAQVDNVPLTPIGKTTTSHFERGELYETNDGLAEMTLSHGVSSDGQDIIAATITNTGQEKFYVKIFGLNGETDQRISALGSLAIDSDYDPNVSPNMPASKTVVVLNPGESLSSHIKGKWTVSEINQPITKFGGTVLFYFDNASKFYDDGYNWVIAVTN